MTTTRYSEDHEWVRLDDDGRAVIGISDFAQKQLGDIVYVEMPEIGRKLEQHEEAAVVESVKAASDVKIPLSGTVVEINERLQDNPELVNNHPEDDGWFIKLTPDDPEQMNTLMDATAYAEYTSQEI